MPTTTAQQYQTLLATNPYLRKFLDLIGWAEGATYGYNTGFGNRYFASLRWHPYAPRQFSINDPVTGKRSTTSAAGKYQFQRGTWETVAERLGLRDFSGNSQDLGAIQKIADRGQLANVLSGNIATAVKNLGGEWQSFRTRSLDSILQKFGVTGVAPNTTGAPSVKSIGALSAPVSFDPSVTVIGARNRYLFAFAILVVIFIFAFKR